MPMIPATAALTTGIGGAVGEALPQIVSDLSPAGQAKLGLVKKARERLKGVYKGFSDAERTKALGESLRALGGRENEALRSRLKGAKGAFVGGALTKMAGEEGKTRADLLAKMGGELTERSGRRAQELKAADEKLVGARAKEIGATYGRAAGIGAQKGVAKGLETFKGLFETGSGSAGDSAPEISIEENVAAKALGVEAEPDPITEVVVGGETLKSTLDPAAELAALTAKLEAGALTVEERARLAELVGE